MPFSSCITTKNVYAKEAKPASYFSHIATNANTDAAQLITSSLKTPRDEETGHFQKQTSRLIATNRNISDVDWLHSLNEDITWIQGDPIQAISQQLNQSKQVGKSISELHIVAHGSNGEIKLGNTFLTKQYLERSSELLQEWKLEAIYLWSCGLGNNTNLLSTLESITGAEIFASKNVVDRNNTSIDSNKGNSAYLERISSQKEIEAWNGNLATPSNSYVTVHTGHIDSGATDYFRYYGPGHGSNGAGVAILQSMPWWGEPDLAEEWALNSNYASPNLNIDGGTGGDEEQVAFAYDFYLWGAARNTRYKTKRKPDDYHNYGGAGGDEVGQHWSGGYAVDYTTFSGITLNQTGPRNGTALLTTEAGGSSTFTVVLDTAPTANVTVTITGLKTQEGSLDTDTLTFTPANWDTPQTVTVTGVDDAYANGDYTYSLIATASNTGGYAGTERAATNVTNIDDDTNGITIAQTGTNDGSGNLLTTEAGGTSTFTVVLNAQPTADVTVSLTGNDATEDSLSNNTLTFTTANWNTAQTVTVTGVDDSIVDGDITTTLTATANNAGGYAGTESDTTTVKNTDNETSGVTIAQTGTNDGSGNLLTTEAGGTSTFTVVLNAQPTADVTVSLTGNDATEDSLSNNTLTFTTANWNTAQTVTVTGVDDSIVDGDITTTLTATANNAGGYAGTESDTTTVKNTDNETSGVTIAQTGTNDGSGNLLTTEAGGTSTFTVVLNAQPTADVTVSLTGNDATEDSLSNNTLTFTTANWNTAQTVTVTGVDDSIVDGDITTTLTATANNAGGYAGTESDTTTVKNTDNETSGVTIAQTGTNDGSGNLLTTEAGGTSTFTVVLNAQPTADVTVSLTGNDATEDSLSNNTLTFTTANWNTAQTVTVTGVDDSIVDGDITTTLTATANNAGGYAGTETSTVTVKNIDDDKAPSPSPSPSPSPTPEAKTPGVTITQTGTTDDDDNLLTTEEGSSSGFTVVLDDQPSSNVTVSLSGNDSSEGSLSTDTLTFTPRNWKTPQHVSVTGVDDSIIDGDITTTITATANNAGGYAGTETSTVTIKNKDDDKAPSPSPLPLPLPTPEINVDETDDNNEPASVVEKDSINRVQKNETNTQPDTNEFLMQNKTDEILTHSSSHNNTNNEPVTTFSADILTNYSTSELPIIAINDYSLLGDSGGSGENPKSKADGESSQEKGVKIITNSFVTASDDNFIENEAYTVDVFYVVLTGAPSDDVQVTLEVPNPFRGSLSKEKFIFTPKNWNTPQKVSFKQEFFGGQSKEENFKIRALASESGGYTGSEQDAAIVNVSKPKKQVQKVLSSIKQTKNSPDKDPTNLDIERITTREEISPIFSILRVIYFPIIAVRLTLGSLKIFQRNHTDSIQSRGQIKNQQVSHLFQKELIAVEEFDWAPNQQSSPRMNNDQHFLNEYSSFLDQISQPVDPSYL